MTPRSVTWASVVANMALAAAKILAGIFTYSQTILADGLHSGSDLVTDIAVLAGLRVSSRPADSGHNYGHGRVSTLVAMFVGAALLAAAGWIAYSAISSLHEGSRHNVSPDLPFWLAMISIPVKEILFRVTRTIGRRTGNLSLIANAWHHRTDAFTSIAAAIGLGGVIIGGADWQFLDAMTAMVLTAFLIVVAMQIMIKSGSELIDSAPSEESLAQIEEAVTGTAGVVSYHAMRARQVGGAVEMDIHIQVDPLLTVGQGHDIAAAVKRRLLESPCDISEVIVHIEPAEKKDIRG